MRGLALGLGFGLTGNSSVASNLKSLFPEAQLDLYAGRYSTGNWVDQISGIQFEEIGNPTHNSDRFELDGSDGFKTTALPTISTIQDLHKTTGGADVTLGFYGKSPAAWAGTQYFMSNTEFTGGEPGFDVRVGATGVMTFVQTLGGAGGSDFDTVTLQTLSANTPFHLSIALNSTAGTLKSSINGTSYTDLSAGYAPKTTTSNPSRNLRLCVNAAEGVSNFLGNGAEIDGVYFINKILSDAELVTLNTYLENR